jgi:hypothetical protein
LTAIVLLACLAGAHAQEPADEPAPDIEDISFSSGRSLALFPSGNLYPVYVADPQRPNSAAMVRFYTRTEIPDSTSIRVDLKGGGRFGLVRLDPATPDGRSWQFSFEAGLSAQFDSNRKLDSVGWDGNYGATLTTASSSPLSFKFALIHRSAHVGDEYAERTGRKRIGYTREELAFGIRWRLTRSFRFYSEAGHAHYMLSEIQEPWRVQGGLEYQSPRTVFGNRFAWYAALDVSAMEERSWQPDVAVQAGLATRRGGQQWRIGVEYYRGRPPFGEFYQRTEAHFTLGIWMDI